MYTCTVWCTIQTFDMLYWLSRTCLAYVLHVFVWVCTYVFAWVCTYVFVWVCTHVFAWVCTYVFVWVCTHVFVWVCIPLFTLQTAQYNDIVLSCSTECAQDVWHWRDIPQGFSPRSWGDHWIQWAKEGLRCTYLFHQQLLAPHTSAWLARPRMDALESSRSLLSNSA